MWKIISTDDDVKQFMEEMGYFHDSCIKEMSYVSGAYVNEKLAMCLINNQRMLRVVIQRQYKKDSMIEMEFHGLKALKLFPMDENYTCDIFKATMMIKEGNIYWCDCDDLSETDSDEFTGTLICASTFRWRSIENHMGEKQFYNSDV